MKVNTGQTTDIFKFKVKTKDIEAFCDDAWKKIDTAFEKKGQKYDYLIENPHYEIFEEDFEKIKYGDWAAQNLKEQKGFDVDIPKGFKNDASIDFYILKSEKAQKKYKRKFDSMIGAGFQYIKCVLKSQPNQQKFINKVSHRLPDVHYADASELLAIHDVNKHMDKSFKKFLKKFNVKEIEYRTPEAKKKEREDINHLKTFLKEKIFPSLRKEGV